MDNILLTVSCITYNHVHFIRKCFEGILMQETNFNYEVLIHDDASTDGTTAIIREYEMKYPGIVKPLIQTVNQYSQGKKGIYATYNHSRAQGKYMALCEGDDYWTDPHKLQRQVDFLERHPECTMCYHPSRVIYVNKSRPDKIAGPRGYLDKKEHVFTGRELIVNGLGVWTAAMMVRTEVVKVLPDWYFKVTFGDLALKLLCSEKGSIGYIGGMAMSVYNRGVYNAWSYAEGSRDWEEKRLNDHYQVLDFFNAYSGYRFKKEIKVRKRTLLINYMLVSQNHYSRLGYTRLIRKNIRCLMNFKSKKVKRLWLQFLLGKKYYLKMQGLVKAGQKIIPKQYV
jgi:glycosyltransferase involved in cell wall biosynthesis